MDEQALIDAACRGDLAAFNRLLAYQDQILYDWLMGHAVPADADIRDLVQRIRRAMLG